MEHNIRLADDEIRAITADTRKLECRPGLSQIPRR
jgi:hypothetical protein